MAPPERGALRRLASRGALAVASPVLLGLYAWFPALAFLPYVALVPWILLYTDDRRPGASAAWYVVGAWLAWMLQHPGVAHFGWFVSPVMAAVLGVGWLPFPFLIRPIHRAFGWPRAITVPVVWVALEWLRSAVTLAHFDLYALGYSQARFTPLIQVADLTGVAGISFLLAGVNGWIADLIVARRRAEPLLGERRRLIVTAATFGALFVAAYSYGLWRLARSHDEVGPRVAIVQPNIEHNERNAIAVHLSEVIFTDERVPASAADLIVWPENAILDNIRRPGIYLPDLARLARDKGALLLVGGMAKVSTAPGRTTNGAYLVDGDAAILGSSLKQVLFPWSESVPGDALLRKVAPPLWRLQRLLVRKGWGFVPTGMPGDETVVLSLPWKGAALPFGVLICVENAYAPIPAEASRRGARLLVNITSEREVGGPVQEQLLRISMLRAVETRAAYVRCGNSGISGIIDPEGRLRGVLRGERGGTIGDQGVLIRPVMLGPGGPTLYARGHDAFAWACVLGTLTLLASSLRRRRTAAAALIAAAGLLGAACGAAPAIGTDAAAAPRQLELGRTRLAQGDPAGAIGPLVKACASDASCGEAVALLADAYRASRRLEEGADTLGAIAQARPSARAEALVEQSRLLQQTGDWNAAERALVASAALAPSASTWAALGGLRLRREATADALQAFDHALAADPADPQIRYLHARAQWLTGATAAAEREIDALLADAPDHGAAWAVKGRLRAAAGDEPGALEAYRKALAGDPANVEARLMLARFALVKKDFGEAERRLDEIRALDARSAPGRRGGSELDR